MASLADENFFCQNSMTQFFDLFGPEKHFCHGLDKTKNYVKALTKILSRP